MMNDPTPQSGFPHAAIDALWRGNKIEAIKHLRRARNLGLKEAKDAVEAYLCSRPDLQRKMDQIQAETRQRVVPWLIGLLVLAAAVAYTVLQGR